MMEQGEARCVYSAVIIMTASESHTCPRMTFCRRQIGDIFPGHQNSDNTKENNDGLYTLCEDTSLLKTTKAVGVLLLLSASPSVLYIWCLPSAVGTIPA